MPDEPEELEPPVEQWSRACEGAVRNVEMAERW